MSVVRAAMRRVSGDVEASRVLPESAVITPPLSNTVSELPNQATTASGRSHGPLRLMSTACLQLISNFGQ